MKAATPLLLMTAVALAACATKPGSVERRMIYACDGGPRVTVVYADDVARIEDDGGGAPVVLRRRVSGSGLWYESPTHTVRSRGNEIVYTVGRRAPMICRTATQGPAPAPAPDTAHSSRNSLDWAGTYRGVLPCADCEGIETIVTLRADGSYSATSRYLGKDSKPAASQGRFNWSDQGGAISLAGEEPARYRVGENRLTRLALDGSPVTGALADRYVLTKMTDAISEKYWKLVELRGQPVPRLDREPHIILHAQDGRVTGFGGCNRFTGAYTLDEARSRVRFGRLASTRMACPSGMDVDRAFGEVLEQVDSYSVNGDRLTLNRARMAPLARFEAVYLR